MEEFGITRDIVKEARQRGEFVVGDISEHVDMDEDGVGDRGIGYVVEISALRQFLINHPELVMADSRLMAFIDPGAYLDDEETPNV